MSIANEAVIWSAIHTMSDIRAGYSFFDFKEADKHSACGLAIRALREKTSEPNIYTDDWDITAVDIAIITLGNLRIKNITNLTRSEAIKLSIELLEEKRNELEKKGV